MQLAAKESALPVFKTALLFSYNWFNCKELLSSVYGMIMMLNCQYWWCWWWWWLAMI